MLGLVDRLRGIVLATILDLIAYGEGTYASAMSVGQDC